LFIGFLSEPTNKRPESNTPAFCFFHTCGGKRIIGGMENFAQKIAQLRREYAAQPLDETAVDADPLRQFGRWFDEAVQAQELAPEAMTLSTATPEGRVTARLVLLKGCDERGFVFFTNYESRKSRELAANPHAALTFFWPTLHRQIRIEGRAERISAAESAAYFQIRPRGSQLGAWASPQSETIASRALLEQKLNELAERFGDGEIPCPPFWGGFLVRPTSIEFWQGQEDRLHDRLLYTLRDGVWRLSRLAP
jgi:pyridoxamine 5'-phosphate oxidase